MPKSLKGAVLVVGMLASHSAWSLPMGFKDSWMFMAETSAHGREATVNYALTHKDAVGLTTNLLKHEDRPHRWEFNELLYVRKAHRWNLPDAQANFWLMASVGQMAGHNRSSRVSYSPGFQLDYETTRVYAGLNAKLVRAKDVNFDTVGAKLGFSFYEVEYNQVQPWFMLDLKRTRELSQDIEITPTLRFIHNRYFFEVGVNTSGDLRASFMYLY